MAANPYVGTNITDPTPGGTVAAMTETASTNDTHVNQSVSTDTFGNAISTLQVGISMALRRRVFLTFPVQGHFTSAYLKMSWAAAPGSLNAVILPVVEELAKFGDLSDLSWDNFTQSGTPDAFDTVNALTTGVGSAPGGNTDNDHRCVFASAGSTLETAAVADAGSGASADNVITPSSGTLAAVFNRAQKAAIEQGTAYFVVMIVHEDDTTGAGQLGIAGSGHGSPAPSYGGMVSQSVVENGLILACRLKLGLPNITATTKTIEAQMILGHLDWSLVVGSGFDIEYANNAALTSSQTVGDVTVSGSKFGDPISVQLNLALSGLDANGFFYYRVVSSVQSKSYQTAVCAVRPHGGKGAGVADSHQIVAMNGGFDDSAEVLQVQAASWARLRALCDGTKANHLSRILLNGDCWDFGQTTSLTLWPIAEDGSGLSEGGAASIIAIREFEGSIGMTNGAGTSFDSPEYTDWTDISGQAVTTDYVVEIVSGAGSTIPGIYAIASVAAGAITLSTSAGANAAAIVFNIKSSKEQMRHSILAGIINCTAPYELVPCINTLGNHAPYHAHGLAANNAFGVNITQDALDAMIEFQLIPPASVTPGYAQPVGHEGRGHFTFTAGENDEVQVVCLNPGIDSLRTGGWTSGDYPIAMGVAADWQLHDDVRDWRNGLLSTSAATFWDEFIHDFLGTGLLPLGTYDRSGKDQVKGGYRLNNLDVPIRASKFYQKCKMNAGHDHNDEKQEYDGIVWHWLATPGEAGANTAQFGGPYGIGFVGPNYHRLADGRKGNAGIYKIDYSAAGIRYDYIATLITTSPTDFLTTNIVANGLVDQGYSDGDVVRTVTVPSGGASKRIFDNKCPMLQSGAQRIAF